MTPLRRYLAHFRPYPGAFVASAALMAVGAAVPGAAIWLLQQTLDDVLVTASADQLAARAAGFAGLYALGAITNLARTAITKRVAWEVTSGLRRELHARYLALSPWQQGATGERISALTHDVDELQYGVSGLVTAFRNPLTLIVLGVTAVTMAPRLAPWALLLLPAAAVATRWGGSRLRDLGAEVRDARGGLVKLMQEQLAGLRTVQAFAAEERERERFAAADEADRRVRLRMEIERVLPSALVEVLAAGAVAVLLWAGGRQVVAGDLEPGGLVGFAVALGLMSRPLSGLSEVWSLIQRSLAALEKVYATLDTPPAVQDGPDATDAPDGPLEARWEGVVVDYGAGPVLKGVDLVVRPGERVALVGPTGEGKSTLLGLVARFRDPDEGVVRLGGADVKALRLASVRRKVAVVSQDGFLFARTVAENVALGRSDATREQIVAALRLAGADFAVDLLDTPLDERGARLSGGERQRICLARALLTEAPVLLLDEATNQVDAATEAAILAALERVRADRAVLMVAHNLSAVRDADRIVVLDGGRIVEQGRHDELLRARGRYAQLWAAQGARDVA